jgi:hypothetical protein
MVNLTPQAPSRDVIIIQIKLCEEYYLYSLRGI